MKNTINEDENVRNYLTCKEMLEQLKNEPPTKMIWSGIKDVSWGFLFGPPKSGKTIFCENLAISLAIGRESFWDLPLNGKPEKVLFIALEEFWKSRGERLEKQLKQLNSNERKLLDENYMFQPIDFPRFISTKESWDKLYQQIAENPAKIIFIDSLTRMCGSSIEESKEALKIAHRLRNYAYDLNKTLIIVHHSTKGFDRTMTSENMAGSRVLSQEADFLIGITKTSRNDRYLKNVDFRYAPDDQEKVSVFKINENLWLNKTGEEYEHELIKLTDNRYGSNNKNRINDYITENTSVTLNELKKVFVENDSSEQIPLRTLQYNLKKLIDEKKVDSPEKGLYIILNENEDEDGSCENGLHI